MKRTLLLSFLISLTLASASRDSTAAPARRQVEHFSKDGLSFDYPAGWTLQDRSTAAAQNLILGRAGSSVLIMVVAGRDPVTDFRQFTAARDLVTTPNVEGLARSLGLQRAPTWDEAQCLDLGERLPVPERFARGFRLSGRLNGRPSTGEVYALALGHRLVNLVYVRNDADEGEGAAVWRRVLDTLRVDAPRAAEGEADFVSGGVLNGSILKKPQPPYPLMAKQARQEGTVVVAITVDEGGNVISAKAISGEPLLRDASEKAAMSAKLAPATVCGHPVRQSGVITYNFVIQ